MAADPILGFDPNRSIDPGITETAIGSGHAYVVGGFDGHPRVIVNSINPDGSWTPTPTQFRAAKDNNPDGIEYHEPYKAGTRNYGTTQVWVPEQGFVDVAGTVPLVWATYRSDGSVATTGFTPDGKWHEATVEVPLTNAEKAYKAFHDLLAGIR